MRSTWDLRRLALACVVVPPSAPTLLVLQMLLSGQRLQFFDGLGIVLLYAVFSFAALVVLGAPLLFLFVRLRWRGFFPFIVGGAVCAALTYTLVVRGQAQRDQLALFTTFGIVEGFVFRLILGNPRLTTLPESQSACP